MRWQRLTLAAALLVAWAVFAAWQYHGYFRERELIAQTLHQPAHSVMNALLGGIRSHRRLGRFFEVQVQGLLDELVQSEDVLAVAIRSTQGETLLAAGRTERLAGTVSLEAGDHWSEAGFVLVQAFDVQPTGPCPPGMEGRGGGWGRGRGLGAQAAGEDEAQSPFGRGGRFLAFLMLDRSRYDTLNARSARSHALVTLGGGVVLLLLALAWRASVRLVDTQGRTRLIETETRHLREMSQAAAGLAHETRNPLGLIRGWTQRLAEAEVDDGDRRRHAQAVMEECDRVTARINQFLAFARPCAPRVGPVNPSEIVDELSVLLQPDLESRNVRLASHVEPGVPHVLADRELLRQAVFNLVQNAVQFAPEGATVTIGVLRGANGHCRIEVADDGPGVPDQSRPSLFTAYFTTRPTGTGLGLAIVRRIAAAHGWEASYQPRPGGGAIFALQGIHGGH